MENAQRKLSCLFVLFRYISERLRQTVVGEGLLGALQTHPQYSCVRRMMEVCPELSERPVSADTYAVG